MIYIPADFWIGDVDFCIRQRKFVQLFKIFRTEQIKIDILSDLEKFFYAVRFEFQND